jgi:hypothetical protein
MKMGCINVKSIGVASAVTKVLAARFESNKIRLLAYTFNEKEIWSDKRDAGHANTWFAG